MPDSIRPHRLVLDDRFSVMGFTIRTDAPAKWFEVALATDPQLFRAEARGQRSATNFYSSRTAGALLAERGEAVYLVPTEVLGRFVGGQKLYYALATFRDPGRSQVEIASLPVAGSPWIDIKSFSGRALRRLRGVTARAGANGSYGGHNGAPLEWAGDAARPEMQPVSGSSVNGSAVNITPGNGTAASAPSTSPAQPATQGLAFAYDDGFDPKLWAQPQAAYAGAAARALNNDVFHDVQLMPQPDKLSCWAGAMAMLVSYRRQASVTPERLAEEVGRSLRTSYGWDMLEAVKDHFGFRDIALPSNASIYLEPAQWQQWLNEYGPLWVTTIGAPSHAIVVHGISGDLSYEGTSISILNPWDTRQHFDGDQINFHPPNYGHAYTQSFAQFAADFGNLGLDDYGRWRVLYLPAGAAQSQSLGRDIGQQSPAARPLGALARPLSDYIPLDPGNGGRSISEDALAIGDIIVSTVSRARVSRAIRWATDSEISHALLYIGGGQVVEAIGEGVVLRSLAEAVAESNVAVAVRHPHITETQALLARDFVGQQLGHSFNWLGIIRQALFQLDRAVFCRGKSGPEYDECVNWVGRVNLGTAANDQFFCSQLVVAAYEHAGVPLSSTPPHWNSPHDLVEIWLAQRLNYIGHLKAPPLGASQGLSAHRNGSYYGHAAAHGNGQRSGSHSGAYGLAPGRAANGQLGQRAVARPFEVVRLDYAPSNAQDAQRLQLEFQQRYQQWLAGVTNTSFFPHSAICQLVDENGGGGTGFYIAPDRILTAAHVVEGVNSLTIIPGKNGGTDPNGPFGSFMVDASAWAIHPRRTPRNPDFDLAVIVVSTPPPHGEYFHILEELRQSLPSATIVCGYSAESDNPAVTAAIDPDRQHLDGDYIRTLDAEVFQYNLQTLRGASGAPVYYAWGYEDEQRQMSVVELHVTGVHVSRVPESNTLNRGCRLTDDKIQWIRSVGSAQSQGLGVSRTGRFAGSQVYGHRATSTRALSGQSFSLNWDDVQMIPQPTNATCWATAAAMLLGWRDQISLTPETVVELAGRTMAGGGVYPHERRQLALDLGLTPEEPQSYTIEGFRTLLENNGPLWVGVGPVPPLGPHAIVVTGMYSNGAPDGSDTYVRITDPWDRDSGTPGAPGAYRHTHQTGSRYILAWSDFVREYEERATATAGTVNVQITHAGGAFGHTPNRSGATGYAMGQARLNNGAGAGRARMFFDQVSTAANLALKEADYAETIGEDEDAARSEPPAAATLTNEDSYRIIREVVVPDSGEALYAAVVTDRDYGSNGSAAPRQFGLAFGLALFTQESGRLGSVLRLMQKREAALFAEVFGAHADALLATTNAATPAERLQPVGGEPLWSEVWLERFRRAGALPACQAAQNEEAIEGQFRPVLRVAGELGLTTDRGLAMAYDRVVTQGLGGGLRWLVQAAGPLRTAAQRSHALAVLGYQELAQFQSASGLAPSGRFTHQTHAALVGALRRQGAAVLPRPDELTWRLHAAATGAAKQRLRRLLDSANFTDIVYALG